MSRRVLDNAGWLLAATCAVLGGGCVERQYVILTDGGPTPQATAGAIVLENGRYAGPTPLIRPFQYYGRYKFTIIRDGYEILAVKENIKAPWYQYFPLDFVSENLIPWTIRDRREFVYTLRPLQIEPPEAVLGRATQMRADGQSIGTPLPPSQGVVPPPGHPAQVLPPGQVPPGQLVPGQVTPIQPPPAQAPQGPLTPVPQVPVTQ